MGVASYYVKVSPTYRKNNKLAYEYSASVISILDATHGHAHRVVWRIVARLRRDAKAAADYECAIFRARLFTVQRAATLVAERSAPKQQRSAPAGLSLFTMLGRSHTAEAKSRIAAALRARHAEGVYSGVALGRPSNAQRAATLAAEGASNAPTKLRKPQAPESELNAARAALRAAIHATPQTTPRRTRKPDG